MEHQESLLVTKLLVILQYSGEQKVTKKLHIVVFSPILLGDISILPV